MQPVTCRLAALLLSRQMTPEALQAISTLLWNASKGDVGSDARIEAMSLLESIEFPDLDTLIDFPIHKLNPSAPIEELISDCRKLRDEWRKRHKRSNTRTNEKKYADYLNAWDLREGWVSGHYNRSIATRLKDVAKQLGKSATTTRN
jgi:hypothetical protein